jgi:hypothetical protein
MSFVDPTLSSTPAFTGARKRDVLSRAIRRSLVVMESDAEIFNPLCARTPTTPFPVRRINMMSSEEISADEEPTLEEELFRREDTRIQQRHEARIALSGRRVDAALIEAFAAYREAAAIGYSGCESTASAIEAIDEAVMRIAKDHASRA